jgi:peptidoglycan hydrolase-like protein with peptidoglycan-binding domain
MDLRLILAAVALAGASAFAQTAAPPQAASDPYVEFNKRVQEALKQRGFYDGPINGDIGPNTQAALAQFQLSEVIPASGMLDAQTLEALGVQREQDPSAGG